MDSDGTTLDGGKSSSPNLKSAKTAPMVVKVSRRSAVPTAPPSSLFQLENAIRTLKNDRVQLVNYLLLFAPHASELFLASGNSEIDPDLLLSIFTTFLPENGKFFKDNANELVLLAKAIVQWGHGGENASSPTKGHSKPFSLLCEFLMDDEKKNIQNFWDRVEKATAKMN